MTCLLYCSTCNWHYLWTKIYSLLVRQDFSGIGFVSTHRADIRSRNHRRCRHIDNRSSWFAFKAGHHSTRSSSIRRHCSVCLLLSLSLCVYVSLCRPVCVLSRTVKIWWCYYSMQTAGSTVCWMCALQQFVNKNSISSGIYQYLYYAENYCCRSLIF
jgi:hypothetical protein